MVMRVFPLWLSPARPLTTCYGDASDLHRPGLADAVGAVNGLLRGGSGEAGRGAGPWMGLGLGLGLER